MLFFTSKHFSACTKPALDISSNTHSVSLHFTSL